MITVDSLEQITHSISHCGDYGHCLWQPQTNTVFWMAGDADGDQNPEIIRTKFIDHGVSNVLVELESEPTVSVAVDKNANTPYTEILRYWDGPSWPEAKWIYVGQSRLIDGTLHEETITQNHRVLVPADYTTLDTPTYAPLSAYTPRQLPLYLPDVQRVYDAMKKVFFEEKSIERELLHKRFQEGFDALGIQSIEWNQSWKELRDRDLPHYTFDFVIDPCPIVDDTPQRHSEAEQFLKSFTPQELRIAFGHNMAIKVTSKQITRRQLMYHFYF